MDKLRSKFIQNLRKKGIHPGMKEYIMECIDYDFQLRAMERSKKCYAIIVRLIVHA